VVVKKFLKINLNTNDLNRAAQKVEALNKQHEALWTAMRGNKAISLSVMKEWLDKVVLPTALL